jgi:signal transduction histidine kinase
MVRKGDLSISIGPLGISRIPTPIFLVMVFILSSSLFLLVEVFKAQLYIQLNAPYYLSFHNFAELLSVVVSLSIFGIGWFSFDQSKDQHALFLSAAFLGIGLFDLMHTLSFPGMPDFFTPSTTNKAVLFWISARIFTAGAFLLSAFIFPTDKKFWGTQPFLLAAVLVSFAIIFIIIVFYPAYLPAMFIEGSGLTPFKIYCEYFIIGLFILSFAAFTWRSKQISSPVLVLYLTAFLLCILSEIAFTLYKSAYDTYNMLGHIYKVTAFLLIYWGIFITSINKPYTKLRETSEQLRLEIIEHQQVGDELQRLNRELQAISKCHQILLRAKNEQTLLDEICRIICEEAGYCMAWVGYAEHDEAKTVRPVAWAGTETGYIKAAQITWADVERGRGPTGVAIRQGEVVYTQDFATDPRMSLWRESALKRGYRSSIALPLKDDKTNIFGALTIYSTKPNSFTQDELRLLTEFADNLAFGLSVLYIGTELKLAEDEIRKFNQELEKRIQERTIELEVANKELEAFSYSVSHDLRAPLRSISGFVGLLSENLGTKLDPQSQQYIQIINKSIKRMNMLIDDLLSFSRMSRSEMSKTEVDLEALVKDVVQEIEIGVKGRSINWFINDLPVVTGDYAMLRVVLFNLLSNAVKFTATRASAEIEVGYQFNTKEETIIFVKDNGVGFDNKYASKLFGVFQRLHRSDEFEGTGIGLANVRQIISRHGGRSWAEGQPEHGATFYFSLPHSGSEH